MTLIIKKVELTNIRSHRYLSIDFTTQGVTAITGNSGSGKSTVVDSIAWVLFGTKPSGVSRISKLVNEDANLAKEKCKATLTLELDGSLLKVERRLLGKNAASTECEVWERKPGQRDFITVAGPAVSHAERYIKKRLHMDEKGFLTAVLVQQKSVDDLIKAKASERGEMIEKLMGIHSITAALQEARQNYNSLKKSLAASTVDADATSKLAEEVTSLEAKFAKSTSTKKNLEERYATLNEQYSSVKDALYKAETAEERRTALEGKLQRASGGISTLEEELKRLTEAKEERRKTMPAWASAIDLQESERKLSELRGQLRTAVSEDASLKAEEKALQRTMQERGELLKASSHDNLQAVQEEMKQVEVDLTELEGKERECELEAASARSESKRMHSASHVLEEGEGACPTCLQKVDDPQEAVEKLTGNAQDLDKKAETLATKADGYREERKVLRTRLEELRRLADALSRTGETEADLAKVRKRKTEVEKQVIVFEQEQKLQERNYREAVKVQEVKEVYDKLLRDATVTSDRIEALRRKVEEYKQALKSLSTEGDPSVLRNKFTTLVGRREELAGKLSEAREESSLLAERLKYSRLAERQAQEELEAYQGLRESVETAGGAMNVIEEFRQERIRSSVPLVGAYATDLFTRFTEGAFMSLKLDEKFNSTVITNNGREREVGMLSGGELSAAGLALRVAIALLLNRGSEQVPLILDEAFASQDPNRLEAMLNTIVDIFQGQVILISHGANTKEIADTVIEL